MASKRNMNTKYTFKGSSKIDNKYANIFQDLNEKQEKINTNSLLKMTKDDIEKKEVTVEEKYSIREVTKDEAEENALKRKQVVKNEQILATQKSSPVVSEKQSPELDRIESLERLKREKRAEKEGLDTLEDGQEQISMDDISQDTRVFNNVDDLLYGDRWDTNPNSIRELAKNRASMDKSNVEIYKEYSDFDRSYTKKPEREPDAFNLSEEVHGEQFYDDEIKKRENEIEELIRLMKRDNRSSKGSRVANKAAQKRNKPEPSITFFNKSTKDNSNNRAEVYINNSKKNEPRVNFKKLALLVVVGLLVILFIAAGIDKLLADRKSNQTNNTGKTNVTTTKDNTTKTNEDTTTKISREEKAKKLEGIRSKLNSEESQRLDYIISNINSYPDEFIDLLLRNHETVDFVYSYKDREKYNQRELSKSITSSYYVNGDVPLFLQWDRRWGYRKYGNDVIGLTGCGPTSLAMVIRYFDSSSGVNPYDVAKYSQENGYVSKDNYTDWSLFEKGLSKFGLESKDVVPVEATMKKALDDGRMLLVSVKPGIFTERGHIIVIKGYNNDGDFLINDPNSIVNTNKSWSFDELKNEIRKIWGVAKIGGTTNSSNNNSSNSDTESDNSNSSNEGSGNSDDPSIIQDIN